ncbi:SusC/RagA family TonB-linked outer membrane protein [Chitinophaga ginsengisoli]|uniref:TonB-linked SusC/RagA family outer membrane protein n=1 Tax=Chitinophaga ginsengisoli TaxID=363837 RepID=A0A2P8FQ00_9BACT|nr:TonB-dependent receptor [Chitinophaga ginsengisoli]PSL23735.1 TonB-linked SusC/RagA family outer membrane protein [Chitinophaga ginsengisoli]
MKKSLLLWLFIAMSMAHAMAQSRTISGNVTDARDGSPLPGATVRIKSTSTGTVTDAAGRFTIKVASDAAVLQVSSTGFLLKEVHVAGNSELKIALSGDEKALSEVVVVGYGTQERRNVTGSVGTVKGELLKNLASSSFDKQLAGQITGVQVGVSTGSLGQPARIRIRGVNSITNSSDPLYVVDGVPYISGDQGGSASVSYNPLGDINPADIESVEVLKDGSATAIYGSRASNGVVLITTKKGKQGKTSIAYNAWLAAATPSKKFDLLDADQFINITNEKLKKAGLAEAAKPTPDPDGKPYNTDWQDIILRTAFQQNHSLSFSGATDQTNYYFSLGYANMDGISVGNDQTRYSVRAKLEQKVLERVTFGVNIGVTHTTDNGLQAGTNALSGNVGGAIRLFPNVPAQYADGTYNLSADKQRLGKGANTREIDDNYTNLKYVLDHNVFRNQSMNTTGNAFVNVSILKGLDLRSQIGINNINVEYYRYYDPVHGDGKSDVGSTAQYSMPQFRYNWQNTISFNRTLGVHNIGFVGGLEYQKTRSRYFFASATNLSDVFFGGENIISDAWGNKNIGGSVTERAFESYFARANYAYNDRYLLTATIRRDKISSLPWGNQGATLPGASLGWRISRESFFQNANLSFINDLKLRGGYAKVGNVEIGNYPYAGIFNAVTYGDLNAIQYGQIGNPNLSFETSNKINVGLDLALLDSRVQFSADYFQNNVNNLILAAPTPPSLGVPKNSINVNVGEMNNKGWEFSLSGLIINKSDFRWNANLNLTLVKNKVTKLANNNADIIDTYNMTRVGHSIGAFFGYLSKGVNAANGNPMWEKADGTIVQGNLDASGNMKFYTYDPAKPKDLSTPAAALSFADKRILGEANPTWYGGFNNTFAYKNFDLSINMTFSGGNKVYNITRQESLTNMKFQNAGKELLNRWTTEGQVTDVPRLFYGSGAGNSLNQNGSTNSRFLENGSFLRAQNIGLGYTLPTTLLQRLRLSSLRIYAQVQNAFVITGYSGLDPELNAFAQATGATTFATTNRQPGLDYNTNPVPRTYTFGINLGL